MNTTRLDQFDNSDYKPALAVRILWVLVSACSSNLVPLAQRASRNCLRIFGAKVGRGVIIKPPVAIKYPWKLAVGNHTWIGENVWIDNLGQVTIGSHCCLSQGALLLCGNHNYKKATFDLMVGDITLGDGVWIGARASVGPGVTCGSHSVLTMGSVATQDLEAWAICQGDPAKKQRQRDIQTVRH